MLSTVVVEHTPPECHGREGCVLVPGGQARRSVDARRDGQQVLVEQGVVEACHVRLERPLRDAAANAFDVCTGAEIVELRTLVREGAGSYKVVFERLPLDGVQQRGVDLLLAAQRPIIRDEIVERVVKRLAVGDLRLVANALVRLGLGTDERANPFKGQIGAEVDAVVESIRKIVRREQGAEDAVAGILIDLILRVTEWIVALRIRGWLEDDLPQTVVGNAERRILNHFGIEAVAAAKVLEAPDQERRAARAEAGGGLPLEVHAHGLAIVVLRDDDAGLLQQVAAERELAAVIAACHGELVTGLTPLADDDALPVRKGVVLERVVLLGVEHRLVARVASGGAGALVLARRAIGFALVFCILQRPEELELAIHVLRAGVRVVRGARVARNALARGDEHHAVGTARAVHGRGAGVLEDFD